MKDKSYLIDNVTINITVSFLSDKIFTFYANFILKNVIFDVKNAFIFY